MKVSLILAVEMTLLTVVLVAPSNYALCMQPETSVDLHWPIAGLAKQNYSWVI